jgi:hypothetical protein
MAKNMEGMHSCVHGIFLSHVYNVRLNKQVSQQEGGRYGED